MDRFVIKRLSIVILLIVTFAAFLFLTICTNWLGGPILTDNTTLISGEVVGISESSFGEIKYYISLSTPDSKVLSVIPIREDTKVYNKRGIRLFSVELEEMLSLNAQAKALVSTNVIYDENENLAGKVQPNDIHEDCYYLMLLE